MIDAATTDLALDVLAPGETLPVDFDFWGPMSYIDGYFGEAAKDYTIQVEPYWTWDTDDVLVDLATQNDANEFDEYDGTFTGEILNNSDVTMDRATILIYFVDLNTDEIIGIGYDWVFDEIAPGGVAEYTVNIDIPDGFDISSAEYQVVVRGEPAD